MRVAIPGEMSITTWGVMAEVDGHALHINGIELEERDGRIYSVLKLDNLNSEDIPCE